MLNSNLIINSPGLQHMHINSNKENELDHNLHSTSQNRKNILMTNLFERSSEITKMTQDMTQINNNTSIRESLFSKVQQLEVPNKQKEINFSTSYSENLNKSINIFDKANKIRAFGEASQLKENQNIKTGNKLSMQSIQSSVTTDKKRDASFLKESKGGVEIKIKSEKEELIENIECLEKLILYQETFSN